MKPKWESSPSPSSLPSSSKGLELTLLFPSQACRCLAWSLTLPLGSLPTKTEKVFDMLTSISQEETQVQRLLYFLGRASSQKEKNSQENWCRVRASKDKTRGRKRSRGVKEWGRLCEACLPETQAMKWPDQGPTVIRRSSLLGKRGRKKEAKGRCRRKIVGRPDSLSSFFASDMIPGVVRNDANNFRVITSNYPTLSISCPGVAFSTNLVVPL